MKRLATYLLVWVVLGCESPPRESLTTVILVRHAEKDNDTDQAGLTQKGMARAKTLAYTLQDIELDAIYSTPFRRTEMTAEPVSDLQNIPVKSYEAHDPNFYKKVYDQHKGGTVLIVGHSNTIPVLANRFAGQQELENLTDENYETYYVVTFTSPGKGKVTKMRYGLDAF